MLPEPSEVVNRFFNLIQDGITIISKEDKHKKAWRGDNAKDYEKELSVIQPHFQPLIWGASSVVLFFGTFRLSSALKMRRQMNVNVNISNLQRKENIKNDLFSIPADLLLSLLLGCSISLFLTDKDKLQKDAASIPLVKGRSLIADEFCPVFTQTYNEIPTEFWKKYHTHSLDHPSLSSIHTFVMNCEKRQKFEQRIKR